MRKATLKLDKHPMSVLGWSYDILYETKGGNKGAWGDGYLTQASARRAANVVARKLGIRLQNLNLHEEN